MQASSTAPRTSARATAGPPAAERHLPGAASSGRAKDAGPDGRGHRPVRAGRLAPASRERQIVEIARALADDAKLLILDGAYRRTRSRRWTASSSGCGACATAASASSTSRTASTRSSRSPPTCVQVLRNGSTALNVPTKDVTRRQLVEPCVRPRHRLVGQPSGRRRPPAPPGKAVIQLRQPRHRRRRSAISRLDVREGEVLCLYGKLGSGTTQVAEVCFGLRKPTGGTLRAARRAEDSRRTRR